MRNMFSYCIKLNELNISKYNTNNVNNLPFMFSNMTDMNAIFERCFLLEELDLSKRNKSF